MQTIIDLVLMGQSICTAPADFNKVWEANLAE
jgi:hypothetical protein